MQKFLSNLGFLLLVNLLVKPFFIFGIDRNVQLAVGTEDYGLYFALLNLTLLFNIVLDLGLTNFNNRSISQNQDLLPTYLPNFLVVKFILGIAYLGVLLLIFFSMGYSSNLLKFLLPLALIQFLTSFNSYLRSNVAAFQYFRTDAILSILNRIVLIAICSVLLWGGLTNEFKIEWFIYGEVISRGVTTVVALVIVLRLVGRIKFNIQKDQILKILKDSLPYALVVILMMLYNRLDAIMIERLLPDGADQAGIYAASYRLMDALNNFALLFSALLLPLFSRMLAQKESVQDLTLMSFKLILVFALVPAICCFFYQQPIMEALYPGEATPYWSQIFGMLMLSFVGIAIMYIFGTLLTANGSMRVLNIISVIALILNITLNFLLIPQLKAYGAAVATLATQLLVPLVQMYFAYKILNIKFSSRLWVQIVGFIACIVGINVVVLQYFENWLLGFLIALTASTLLSFVFRLFDLKQAWALLKTRES